MDHGQLSMVADKFQWVFSEALLNGCGKAVKFCRRQCVITPFRLGLALTATCASQRVETIAALVSHSIYPQICPQPRCTIPCKPSARRFNPSTSEEIARHGNSAIHGNTCAMVRVSLIILPQSGVGGGRPRPRKPSTPIVMVT